MRHSHRPTPDAIGRTRLRPAVIAAATLALTAACQHQDRAADRPSPPPQAGPPDTAAVAHPVPDGWLGQWNGPEGTYLQLARSGDHYTVTIRSLDGEATYRGVAAGERIEFVRDGQTESIRAGSGRETGMKWLLEKRDCLVIKEGEGFCRD